VPGQQTAGQHSPALVEFVDIYPSLVELCGLSLPADAAGLEGKSFAPLLTDPNLPWKPAAFSEYPKGGYQGTAMRTDRYRYVRWIDKQGQVAAEELYDHQADPAENENRAAKPENRALLERLARQMGELAKSVAPEPSQPKSPRKRKSL